MFLLQSLHQVVYEEETSYVEFIFKQVDVANKIFHLEGADMQSFIGMLRIITATRSRFFNKLFLIRKDQIKCIKKF